MKAWHRVTLRLSSAAIRLLSLDQVEEDDDLTDISSTSQDEGSQLKYQISVLAPRLEIEVVEQLVRGAGCDVTSLGRAAWSYAHWGRWGGDLLAP